MQTRTGLQAASTRLGGRNESDLHSRHYGCTAAIGSSKQITRPLPPMSAVLKDASKQARLTHLDPLFTLRGVTSQLESSAQPSDTPSAIKAVRDGPIRDTAFAANTPNTTLGPEMSLGGLSISARPDNQPPGQGSQSVRPSNFNRQHTHASSSTKTRPRNDSSSGSPDESETRHTRSSEVNRFSRSVAGGQAGPSSSDGRTRSTSSSRASTITPDHSRSPTSSTRTATIPRPTTRSSLHNSQDSPSSINTTVNRHPQTAQDNGNTRRRSPDATHQSTSTSGATSRGNTATNHPQQDASSSQRRTASTPIRTAPSASSRLLSQYIKSCRSLQELDETFRRCESSSLNVVHLTAIASAVAKAGSNDSSIRSSSGQAYAFQSQQQQRSSSTVLRRVHGQPSAAERLLLEVLSAATSDMNAPNLRPRELSTLTWAAAKLFGSRVPVLEPDNNAGRQTMLTAAGPPPLPVVSLAWNSSLATRSSAASVHGHNDETRLGAQGMPLGLELVRAGNPGWLPTLLELIYQQAGDFKAQDVSMTLWALATLQPNSKSSSSASGSGSYDLSSFAPSTADRKDRNSTADRDSRERNTVHQSRIGSSDDSLSTPNTDRVVRRLVDACLPHLGAFEPQAMSNTLWALATLSARPSDRFFQGFCSASLRQLPDFGAQALANTTWAMVVLDLLPPVEWRSACMSASLDAVRYAPPRAAAQIAWAVARMRFPEAVASPAWLAGMLETLVGGGDDEGRNTSSSSSIKNSGSSRVVETSSTSRLDRRSSSSVNSGFVHSNSVGGSSGFDSSSSSSSSNKLHSCSSQDLANIIYATARLSTQQLTIPLPRPLTPTLPSRPPLHFMHAFLDEAFSPSRLSSYSANELPAVLAALATLRFCPPPDMLSAALEAFSSSMPAASAQALCNVLWAVARLGARPSGDFLDEIVMTLSTKLDDVGPQENANIWWALGSLRWQPGPSAGSELLLELSHKLDDCTSSELAMSLWGIARLDIPLPKLLLDRYVSKLGMAKHSADDIPWALPRKTKLRKRPLAQDPTTSGGSSTGSSSRASSSNRWSVTEASGSAITNHSSSSNTSSQPLRSVTHRSSALKTQRTGAELHPRTLCTVLWSLARMDADSQRTAALGLAYRSLPTLSRFSPADSSIVMYSLARLGCLSVTDTFVNSYCLATTPLLASKAYSSQDLFMSAWAMARLGKAPTTGWTRQLLGEAGRQARLASNRHLVMLFWSLGRIATRHPAVQRLCRTSSGRAAAARLLAALEQRLPPLPLPLPEAALQARIVSHVRLQYQERHRRRQQLRFQPSSTPTHALTSRSQNATTSPGIAPHSMATTAFSSGTPSSLMAAPLRVNTISPSPRYNPTTLTPNKPLPPASLFTPPVMVQLDTLSPRPARRTLLDAHTASSIEIPPSDTSPVSHSNAYADAPSPAPHHQTSQALPPVATTTGALNAAAAAALAVAADSAVAVAAAPAAATAASVGPIALPPSLHPPLSPRDLTHTLTSLVELELPVHAAFVKRLLSAMSASLEQYKIVDLCYSLRSLSRLHPPAAVPVELLQASLNHAAYHVKGLTTQNVEMLAPAVCALVGWKLSELKQGNASGGLRSSDRSKLKPAVKKPGGGLNRDGLSARALRTGASSESKRQIADRKQPQAAELAEMSGGSGGQGVRTAVGPLPQAAVICWPARTDCGPASAVAKQVILEKAGSQAGSSSNGGSSQAGSSSNGGSLAGSSQASDSSSQASSGISSSGSTGVGPVRLEGALLRLRLQLRWLWVAHKAEKHKAVLLKITVVRFRKERWLRSRQVAPTQEYHGQGVARPRAEHRDW